ncbi:ExbD/TolR family protein [Rhabdochlamydiaceae symbiont of Dictyostelium giganteum]|uniref:ExbD/TolR family protein n=1 Tax=Rhabdochlamydiaceae symbiont of Dictyostelium giganteum TaxID=3342349 RepID=UPI00384C3058
MKRSLRHETAPLESEINLTPLIDVVFVLLIVFILVAPLLELDHVELAQGASRGGSTQPPKQSSLTIHVKQDDTIWFQSKCVSADELLKMLKQSFKEAPHQAPQLFQDKRAHFGTYQTVKNAIEIAGYDQMDVILKPH